VGGNTLHWVDLNMARIDRERGVDNDENRLRASVIENARKDERIAKLEAELAQTKLAMGYMIYSQGGVIDIPHGVIEAHDGFTIGRSDTQAGVSFTATPKKR
jgi:hypothetical protein